MKKKGATSWTTLQIKNSDNTMNSSLKTVLENTTIMHWYRRHSKKGTHNWDEFPDAELRKKLSEDDFRKFALDTFQI